jgi:hypothetical protein
MTRRQAFLLNTLCFALAALALAGLVVWLHPGPLLVLNKIEKPFLLTLALGAVTGPGLMLYLYKPGKKRLWLDVTTVVLLQGLVWGYGTWLIWQERPGWLVVAVDRIELIRANEVDGSRIPEKELRRPTPGQPPLVIAHQPDSPRRRARLTMAVLQGEPDIERRPGLYAPPRNANRKALRTQAQDGDHLPHQARQLAEDRDNIVLLPIVGGERVALAALDLADWSLADWWLMNPWKKSG